MISLHGLKKNRTDILSVKDRSEFLKIRLSIIEIPFTVLSLLLFSGALVPIISGGNQITQGSIKGDPVMQAIYSGIYLITGLLLIKRLKRVIQSVWRSKLLWLLVGLALISIFWSSFPQVTLRRTIALIGTTIFGIYFSVRYHKNRQIQILAWVFGIAAFLSIVTVFVLPEYGVMAGKHLSAWRGVYRHKNLLGRLMALSALIFYILALTKRKYRSILWLFFGISIALISLSTSKTALLITILLVILFPLIRITQRSSRYTSSLLLILIITSLPLLILGGIILIQNWGFMLRLIESLMSSLGRDPTLSGRTYIWISVWQMIQKPPWFGYGYNGFWLGWEGHSAVIWEQISWLPPHAHNGFLDLWLDLGIIGLGIFTIGFIFIAYKATVWMKKNRSMLNLWPILYLSFFIVSSLPESVILKQNDIYWILYVSVTLSLSQAEAVSEKMIVNSGEGRTLPRSEVSR